MKKYISDYMEEKVNKLLKQLYAELNNDFDKEYYKTNKFKVWIWDDYWKLVDILEKAYRTK